MELDSTDNLIPFLLEWIENGCKVFIVFREHDSRLAREQLVSRTKGFRGLYIFEDTGIVNDEALNFNVYGMSCDSKQEGFLPKYSKLHKYTHSKPAIFLTHPCALPRSTTKQLGYNYYAVGHIHKPSIEKISPNIYIGRPGHLYSLWDGDGKAWPVGGIIGEFVGGILQLSWFAFPVEQTVRLFIDPFKSRGGKALLVIENCPIISARKVSTIIEGEWIDQKYRGVYKGYVDLASESFRTLLRQVIKIFIDEILVTPSDSKDMKKKYGYSRGVFTAKTLLKDKGLFNEYMDRIVKASIKTQ